MFDAFDSMHDNRWEGERVEEKEKEDKTKKEEKPQKEEEEEKPKPPAAQKVRGLIMQVAVAEHYCTGAAAVVKSKLPVFHNISFMDSFHQLFGVS